MDHDDLKLKAALGDPERLQAIQETKLLDVPTDALFDRLTGMICRDLDVPIAMVTLIESERQFFAGQQGLPTEIAAAQELPISHSICKYVVENGGTVAISDARRDNVLKDHPAVTDFQVVAYLGAPLVKNNQILGSVCAIDMRERVWSEDDIKAIERKANFIRAELYARAREE